MPIDPAWINAGAKVLGEAVKSQPAGPAISNAGSSGSNSYGGDGWIVNFGSGTATGAPINKTDNRQDSRTDSGAGGLLAGVPGFGTAAQAGASPYLMLGLAVLLGGLLLKKLNK